MLRERLTAATEVANVLRAQQRTLLELLQSLKHVVDILSICLTDGKFTLDINC